jgi:hypothetical protein
VPIQKREDLLAVVKWYSDGTERNEDQLEEQVMDADVVTSVLKAALPKVKPPLTLEQMEAMARPYLSMTSTTPDIIRIDIETPDPSSPHQPHTQQPQQTSSTLELIAQREMEGSRIRRSMARQQQKNAKGNGKMKSASVTPVMDSPPHRAGTGTGTGQESAENHEPAVVFTREEVHLLRQVLLSLLSSPLLLSPLLSLSS